MSSYWVTGAKGFIGRHLAQRLAKRGHQVSGIGHGLWPPDHASVCGVTTWINGDVTFANLSSLRALAGRPDGIVHLAGGSSVGTALQAPREDFDRTVQSTADLLEWMRQEREPMKLLVASSAAVYGAGYEVPIHESAATRPFSSYGHHKLIMEELCHSYYRSYGIQTCIARIFSVYGPGLRKQLLWDICTRLSAGMNPLVLSGCGSELRDWIEIRDATSALCRLLEGTAQGVFTANVATGRAVPVRQVAQLVVAEWCKHDTAREIEFTGRSRPGDPAHLSADTTEIRALGFAPEVTLEHGAAGYVHWFKSRSGAPQ